MQTFRFPLRIDIDTRASVARRQGWPWRWRSSTTDPRRPHGRQARRGDGHHRCRRKVGQIGAIKEKGISAKAADAAIFLVPACGKRCRLLRRLAALEAARWAARRCRAGGDPRPGAARLARCRGRSFEHDVDTEPYALRSLRWRGRSAPTRVSAPGGNDGRVRTATAHLEYSAFDARAGGATHVRDRCFVATPKPRFAHS